MGVFSPVEDAWLFGGIISCGIELQGSIFGLTRDPSPSFFLAEFLRPLFSTLVSLLLGLLNEPVTFSIRLAPPFPWTDSLPLH